jgi:hypothetical protein
LSSPPRRGSLCSGSVDLIARGSFALSMHCPRAMFGHWSDFPTSGGCESVHGGFAIDATTSSACSRSSSWRPAATSTGADNLRQRSVVTATDWPQSRWRPSEAFGTTTVGPGSPLITLLFQLNLQRRLSPVYPVSMLPTSRMLHASTSTLHRIARSVRTDGAAQDHGSSATTAYYGQTPNQRYVLPGGRTGRPGDRRAPLQP